MYCPPTSYPANVLSVMKMLTNGNSSTNERVFGFSVKDILDLPTHKSVHKPINNNSNQTVNISSKPSIDRNENCLTNRETAYHSSAAAMYYNNPYNRWLPQSDISSYSSPLRECNIDHI